MKLSPEQLATIRAACDLEQTPRENYDRLSALLVENPTPASEITKPMVPIEMFGQVEALSSKKALVDMGAVLVEIKGQIEQQDHPAAIEWLQVLVTAEKVTPEEYAALEAYIVARRDGTATMPDPAHPAEIPWAHAHLFNENGTPLDLQLPWVEQAMAGD